MLKKLWVSFSPFCKLISIPFWVFLLSFIMLQLLEAALWLCYGLITNFSEDWQFYVWTVFPFIGSNIFTLITYNTFTRWLFAAWTAVATICTSTVFIGMSFRKAKVLLQRKR